MNISVHNSHFVNANITLDSSNFESIVLIIGSYIANKSQIIENIAHNEIIDMLIDYLDNFSNTKYFDLTDGISFFKNKKSYDKLIYDFKDFDNLFYYLMFLSTKYSKTCVFKINKDIDLNIFNTLIKDNNFNIKKDGDDIIFSGKITKDYYKFENEHDIIYGLIFNYLNLNMSATINLPYISYKMKLFISYLNKLGFDINIINNDIMIHSFDVCFFEYFNVHNSNIITSYFLLYNALYGSVNIKNADTNNLLYLIDLIRSSGGQIKINDNEIYAFNSGLLKGKIKKLSAINQNIDNYFVYPLIFYCMFLNGTSNLKLYRIDENIIYFINMLNNSGFDIKINDNIIIIKGNDKYNINYDFDAKNDQNMSMCLLFIGLVNQGTININNLNLFNPNLLDNLISGIKPGAIEIK